MTLLVVLAVAAFVAACTSANEPQAGTTVAAGGRSVTMKLGDRPFRVHVPAGYAPRTPTTLVVALHGWGGTSESMARDLDLYRQSDTRDFLLALPDGTPDRNGLQFWNATDACCDADGIHVDDSTYLSRVIATVEQHYDVGPGRVFVIGLSNGGFMAHRLGCDHADQVAAVVSVYGAQNADRSACRPSRAVSALEVHGTADETVRYNGGSLLGPRYPSVRDTIGEWRTLDGCDAAPGHADKPLDADPSIAGSETTRSWWGPCDDGSEVGLWTVHGAGHGFPTTAAFTNSVLDWLDGQARTSG